MRRFLIGFLLHLCLFMSSAAALAQDKILTIDDLFDPAKQVNFSGNPPSGLRWLKDGTSYLQFQSGQLMRVNAITGAMKPFYDAAKMETAFAALPGMDKGAARQIAHQSAYLLNPAETAALINFAADLFYYEFGSDKAMRLTNNPEAE